jgi:hypothetical protein
MVMDVYKGEREGDALRVKIEMTIDEARKVADDRGEDFADQLRQLLERHDHVEQFARDLYTVHPGTAFLEKGEGGVPAVPWESLSECARDRCRAVAGRLAAQYRRK